MSQVSATSAQQRKPETIIAYKGFESDWKCRGFQYVLGETFEHKGVVKACKGGFHACERPLDVLDYYPPAGSRFAIVEQSGELARHEQDTKVASSRIHIKAEIGLADLIKASIDWTFARAKPEAGARATGDSGAASATGDSGAASATGYSGAASATGDRGAASATGKACAAMASGSWGRALAGEGCAIFLVERDADWNIVAVFAGIGGRDGVKPDTWYTLEDGKLTEVQS